MTYSDAVWNTAPIPTRASVNAQLNLIQVERGNEILAPVPVTYDGREQLIWMEFGEVGGGSTAWLHLVQALDSADHECTPGSSAYWDWAWNTYCLLQAALGSDEDKKLSYAYLLEDLAECSYCGNRVVEYDQVECQHELAYHAGCFDQWVAEQKADVAEGDSDEPCRKVNATEPPEAGR